MLLGPQGITWTNVELYTSGLWGTVSESPVITILQHLIHTAYHHKVIITGTLALTHLVKSQFDDRAPVDEIYMCPIFKWVACSDLT